MAQVIELCRHCGFELTRGPTSCPECGAVEVRPSLAARQVAGLALPTRSVHRLPHVPPLRLVDPLPPAPARAARSAFHGASLFVLFAVLGLCLSWVAEPTQLGFVLPSGTPGAVAVLTEAATWAAMAAAAIGLLAAAAIGVRNAARTRRAR